MMCTYIVLSEILTRFGPALLLFVLNGFMIRDFNTSVRRKRMLKAASTVIAISKSTLFPIALADVLGATDGSKTFGSGGAHHVDRGSRVRNVVTTKTSTSMEEDPSPLLSFGLTTTLSGHRLCPFHRCRHGMLRKNFAGRLKKHWGRVSAPPLASAVKVYRVIHLNGTHFIRFVAAFSTKAR